MIDSWWWKFGDVPCSNSVAPADTRISDFHFLYCPVLIQATEWVQIWGSENVPRGTRNDFDI